MLERIGSPESELDQLRPQAGMLLRATDTAPSQLSAQLATSDVKIDGQQDRLFELENQNQELSADKRELVSKASARPVVLLCRVGSQSPQTCAIPRSTG